MHPTLIMAERQLWRHALTSLERHSRANAPALARPPGTSPEPWSSPRTAEPRSSSSDTIVKKRAPAARDAPSAKRPRTTCIPKAPIPRRRTLPPLEPRSPSSPFLAVQPIHSRVHGQLTPRTPGRMWPCAPPSSPAPPTILVSPPEADIRAIIAKTARPAGAAAVSPEWQFAYVGTLLARDQAAFEKLAWRLDLVFTGLATAHVEFRDQFAPHMAHIAKQAARQVMHLLTCAWKPHTTDDYAHSPPSFRVRSLTQALTRTAAPDAPQILWTQKLAAMVGADLTLRLVQHIIDTVWYMAVQDPKRPFVRPQLMAYFCLHWREYVRRWEAQEAGTDTRLLPTTQLPVLHDAHVPVPAHVPTSTLLRLLFEHMWLAKFALANERNGDAAYSTTHLQVPLASSPCACRPPLHAEAESACIVDAARLLGEMYRLRALHAWGIVRTWLQALLLHGQPWMQVPLYELEAGCALLLLTGASMHHGWAVQQLDMDACSLQPPHTQHQPCSTPSIVEPCLRELRALVHLPLLPAPTKQWLQVRGEIRPI